MRKGKYRHILKDGKKSKKPDSFYEKYLYTFEELLKAELSVLRQCLSAPNGTAVIGAKTKWGNEHWIRNEYLRREMNNLPPMAALDEFCYGPTISAAVPRQQWVDLHNQFPDKVIDMKNVHLKQSMIGRGLYTLPLEWWYGVFPQNEIFFMCTEELSDQTGDALNELGTFLGLPMNQYNFSQSIASGAYNVAGHHGYDTEIPWSTIKTSTKVPLSIEFRKELQEFIRPYNERLFALVGRRCKW